MVANHGLLSVNSVDVCAATLSQLRALGCSSVAQLRSSMHAARNPAKTHERICYDARTALLASLLAMIINRLSVLHGIGFLDCFGLVYTTSVVVSGVFRMF